MNFFDELFTKKKESAKSSQKKGSRDIGARKNANEKRTTRPITNVSKSHANIASKENRHTKALSRSNPDFSGPRGKSSRQTPGVFVDAPQETKWYSQAKPKAVDLPPPPPHHASPFQQLKTVNYNNNEVDLDVEDYDRPMSVTDLDNITFRRGQVAKSEQGQGQGQGEDLSRSSSVTNLNVDIKNKGALSKVRKSASKDRLDKIVDKKPEKKVLTRNNNKIDGEHSYSTETLQEIESLQRQLQEMANEKTNLALQLGEQKGQMHTLENEIQNLKVIQEQLNQENSLLRNRLRDVSHSPLSDNEKQQLLLESHRHHSSAPASIATNLVDDGAGGDITACPTPDWDKHSSSNVSEVSVACLQDKINQMQETHYSTNEELQATLQELTELQRQLTELQQDNERLSEEKALMFDSLCRQTERLNDSRAEVESLKQLLYRDKDDTGQLESVVEREQKLVDLLKNAQDEREALLLKQEQLSNELQDARGANLDQTAVNQQLTERVKTLESTLDAKHAEHKQLDQELALAKDQSSGRQIEINRLSDLLENARTKIIELEQDRALSDKSELDELLDNARKEKDALESEVTHLKEQVARSRNETEKLRDQISILQEECKVTRNNAKCTQSELEYKCEKLVADKNTLSDQLQQLQEAANELQVQAQCQLEDKRQLSSVLSETQRNLSEAERRNLDLENEVAELKRLRKEENEEWEKFQNDLLTSVRVANDFKTEAQQDLQKMIMENKTHRERVRQLEAQLDKMKGEPSPEVIVAAEEMPTEDLASNKERDSKTKSKSPKAFFKKPKFLRHTKGGYYVTTANEGGGAEVNEGGELRVQPSMSPPPPLEHDFVLDDLTLTVTDRPEETSNENEAKPEGKSKKTFGLLPIAKGDVPKTRDSRKMGFIKKHLSAQEQKDLNTLNELHSAIDPNIPEEDLSAEQKFIIKLKQMHDSNFEQTKQKPVAKKPKDNLAISKPLLNSVILNPKLKQIADDPTVRLVEDDLSRDSACPPPETFEFNGETHMRSKFDDVYRSNIEFRYYDIEDSRKTVQSFKPPDDTLTKKSRSMDDLYTHKEEFVQVSNFGVERNISKSSNSLTNYVSSIRPNPSFGDNSAPGVSPFSSDSSDVISIETGDNKGSQDLNVTLDELYAKIDPNLPESQLTKEQKFVRQMKESLDDMGRKHTLKKEQKKKGLIISGPTQQSVMKNPKLVSLIHDPKTIEVKAVSAEPKENMFKKLLGKFKSKKAEPIPPKPETTLAVENEIIPPPGILKNSQSVPSLVSSPPKPLANADSLPSLVTAPSDNVANAESVSSLFQTVIVNSDLNRIIETRKSASGDGSPTLQVKNFQETTAIPIVETVAKPEDPTKTKDVWVDSYDVVVVRHRKEDAPKNLEKMSVKEKIERFSQLSTSSENEAKPRSPDVVVNAPMKNSSAPKHFRTTQMQTDVNLLSKGINVQRPPTNVPRRIPDVPPPLEFQDFEREETKSKFKVLPMEAEAAPVISLNKKEEKFKEAPTKVEDTITVKNASSLQGEEPKQMEDTSLWKRDVGEEALQQEERKSERIEVDDTSITTLWKKEITENALRRGEEEESNVEVVPILPRAGKNRELSRLLMSKIEFTFGGLQGQSEKGQQEAKPKVVSSTSADGDEEVEYAVPRSFKRESTLNDVVQKEEIVEGEEKTKPRIISGQIIFKTDENLRKEAELAIPKTETEKNEDSITTKPDERDYGDQKSQEKSSRASTQEDRLGLAVLSTEERRSKLSRKEKRIDDLTLDRPHFLSIGGKEDLAQIDELKMTEAKAGEKLSSRDSSLALTDKKENSLNVTNPAEEATASRKMQEANVLTFSFFDKGGSKPSSPLSSDGKVLHARRPEVTTTSEEQEEEKALKTKEEEVSPRESVSFLTNSNEERISKKPEDATTAGDKPKETKIESKEISAANERAEQTIPLKTATNLEEKRQEASPTNEKPKTNSLLETKVDPTNKTHLFPTNLEEKEESCKPIANQKPKIIARLKTKDQMNESDSIELEAEESRRPTSNEKPELKMSLKTEVERSNEIPSFSVELKEEREEKPEVNTKLKTKENRTNDSIQTNLEEEESFKSTANEKPEANARLKTIEDRTNQSDSLVIELTKKENFKSTASENLETSTATETHLFSVNQKEEQNLRKPEEVPTTNEKSEFDVQLETKENQITETGLITTELNGTEENCEKPRELSTNQNSETKGNQADGFPSLPAILTEENCENPTKEKQEENASLKVKEAQVGKSKISTANETQKEDVLRTSTINEKELKESEPPKINENQVDHPQVSQSKISTPSGKRGDDILRTSTANKKESVEKESPKIVDHSQVSESEVSTTSEKQGKDVLRTSTANEKGPGENELPKIVDHPQVSKVEVSTANEKQGDDVLRTLSTDEKQPGENELPKINEDQVDHPQVSRSEISTPNKKEPEENESLKIVDHPHYIERNSYTTEEVISYTLILKDGPVHIDMARQTSSTTDATDASFDIDDRDPNFGSQLNAKSPVRRSTTSSISSEDEAILRRLSMRLDTDDLVILRDAQKKYNGPRPKSDINEEDLKLIELARMKYESHSTPSSSESDFDEDMKLIELARARYAEPLDFTDDDVVIRDRNRVVLIEREPYLRPVSDLDEEDLNIIEMSRERSKIILIGDEPYLRSASDENSPKIIEITHEDAISAKDIEMALQDDNDTEKNEFAPRLKPMPSVNDEDLKIFDKQNYDDDDVFISDKNKITLVDDESYLRRPPDLKDDDDDDVIIRQKDRIVLADDDFYIRPVSDFNEEDLKIIEMARHQEEARPTSGLNEEDLKVIDMAKRRDSERRRSDAGVDLSPRIYDVPVTQRRHSLERHSLDSTNMYEPVYENFSKYFAESKRKEGSIAIGLHKPPKPLPRHPKSSDPEKFDDFDSIGQITHQIMDLTKNLSSNENEPAEEDNLNKNGAIPKKPKEQVSISSEESNLSMEILYDSDGEESPAAQSSTHTSDNSYLKLFKSPEQVVYENLSEANKTKPSGTLTLHFFKPDNLSSDESTSSTNTKVSFLRKKFESQESVSEENRASVEATQKPKTPDAHALKNVPKVSNIPKNQNQSHAVDEIGDTEVPPPATASLVISPGSENTSLENLRRNSRKSFENARNFFESSSSEKVGSGRPRSSNMDESEGPKKDE